MDQVTALAAEVRRLQRMVRLLATRATVTLSDSTDHIQRLQLAGLGDEVLDSIEHIEPYGYTSRPLDGAEAIVANLFGNRDHAVALLVGDRRFRLKNLQKGEVALWTDEGDVIHFKRGNQILVDTLGTLVANANLSATVTSPTITVNGDTTINGTLTVNGATNINDILAVTGAATFSSTVVAEGAMSSATSLADPTGTLAAIRVTFNSHDHDETGTTTKSPNQVM